MSFYFIEVYVYLLPLFIIIFILLHCYGLFTYSLLELDHSFIQVYRSFQ